MSSWILLFVVGALVFLFGLRRLSRDSGGSLQSVLQRNFGISIGGSVTQTNTNAPASATPRGGSDWLGLASAIIGLVAALIGLIAAILDALK
jgi:hypothetical protein